ncbi:predicted protein [Nematostella vectensis]|uniref:Seven cysteines N-terminal domain-containing protein n=1 Tax=Nematostella vectensis TaxID=45351 RepID=A7S110_NEMVE|nr:predicted protein [Nematostella vectensis]|eukprot:XP_001634739.1 predicted protein [Nematostella vectensis]
MKKIAIIPLLLSLATLLAITTDICAAKTEKPKCEVKEERAYIIDIKASKKATNEKATVVSGLNVSTEAACSKACCEKDLCNIFIFYNGSSRKINCFLLDCEPEKNCVRKEFANSVVGVMMKTKAIDVDTREMSTEQSSTPRRTTTKPNTAENKTSTVLTSMSTQSSTATVGKANIHWKQPHNHTSKSALVIALCFGFLFLFAVIVQIGRPWLRFLQRPRYSKVDYLMNGL